MNFIKVFFISGLMAFAFTAMGQVNGIDRYFETYKDDERFTQINVSSKMFSLFVNFERDDPDEQRVVDIISKLKGLKVLIGKEVDNARQFYNKALNRPAKEMEELMDITESDKSFKFFITESNGQISELMMLGYDSAQVILLSLVGEIDIKDISYLSRKMEINGFENLQKLEEK